jgi:hypothetical protein
LLIFVAVFIYLAAASEAQLVAIRAMAYRMPVTAAMLTQFEQSRRQPMAVRGAGQPERETKRTIARPRSRNSPALPMAGFGRNLRQSWVTTQADNALRTRSAEINQRYGLIGEPAAAP